MAKRKPRVMKCTNCGSIYEIDETQPIGECKICHKMITELICLRCGHRWTPKKGTPPGTCPSCKNPYWNVERRE